MTTNYHYALKQQINNANSVYELTHLLQSMLEFDFIQHTLQQKVQQLTAIEAKNIFYASSSIEHILPNDIIQNIISFNYPYIVKPINKTFNTLCNVNKNNELKQIQNKIQSKIETNENNQTWIVHPTKTVLTDEEIRLQYKGPMNDLSKTLRLCECGDKILIYDGKYSLFDGEINDEFFFVKSVQIVGKGDNVVIKVADSYGSATEIYTNIGSKIHLKNLRLEYWNLEILENSTVWMEHCHLTYNGGFGVEVCKNASVYISNSTIQGSSYDCDFGAVTMTGDVTNVFIIDSIINDCGGYQKSPCITIPKCITSKLRLIGNTFIIKNDCKAISEFGGHMHSKTKKEWKEWRKQFEYGNKVKYEFECD